MSNYTEKSKDLFLTKNQSNILNLNNLSGQNLIKFMDEFELFVKHTGGLLTNGQARIIYELIHKADSIEELQMVRSKVAFVAAKQVNQKTRELIQDFLQLISQTNTTLHKDNVQKFFTSFLHYHKFFHGDKK